MMHIDLYDDNIGEVSLISVMGDDARSAHSARVSFLKDGEEVDPEKDEKLLRFLLSHKHTSPFEHSIISLRIKVPLFIRNQVFRHRTFSYNEVSRRYTSECIEFHIPKELRKQASKNLQCSAGQVVDNNDKLIQTMKKQVESAYRTYQMFLNCGVSREQARAILPQNTYTTFWMTGNLHNWINFLRLRLSSHAQPEIQELAQGIEAIIAEHFPITMMILEDQGTFR